MGKSPAGISSGMESESPISGKGTAEREGVWLRKENRGDKEGGDGDYGIKGGREEVEEEESS